MKELLRWCDPQEAQLRQSRTLGAPLFDSIRHQILANNGRPKPGTPMK